jgi:hypothetical protein
LIERLIREQFLAHPMAAANNVSGA